MRLRSNRRDERGQLGIEALAFGTLIFIAGTLVFVNGWALVDAKLAATSAAREAARAYVEAPDSTSGLHDAQIAGADALAGYGRDPLASTIVVIQGSFGRCQRVVVEVRTRAPLARVPFVGQAGTFTVVAHHSELVDPYRSGLAGTSACA
jgi:Flp pilus assembly protein TadG